MADVYFDTPTPEPARRSLEAPLRPRRRIKALRAEGLARREGLLPLLDLLAEGRRLSRRESLDLVMAVIEDAHCADPVLFGPDAAGHFARLHEVRNSLDA